MKKNPKQYDTVCFNREPDATVWRVMGLHAGTNYCLAEATPDGAKSGEKWMDRSLFEPATRAQLKNAGLI